MTLHTISIFIKTRSSTGPQPWRLERMCEDKKVEDFIYNIFEDGITNKVDEKTTYIPPWEIVEIVDEGPIKDD